MRTLQILAALGLFACGSSPDGDEPMFQNMRLEELSDSSVVFRFETAVETSCEAEYGLAEDALTERATDPSMDPNNPYSITHEVVLAGLSAATRYYVRARAEDRAGTVYRSQILSFTTEAAPAGGMVNVARLNAGATIVEVSSNFGGGDNDSTWGANKAIDGSDLTEWSSFGDGDDAFITIDLGQSRTLTELRFRSREMTDGSSIITSLTLTTGDGTVHGPFDTPSPSEKYAFTFEPPLQTNRVRIDAVTSTGGNTGAREIELLEAR